MTVQAVYPHTSEKPDAYSVCRHDCGRARLQFAAPSSLRSRIPCAKDTLRSCSRMFGVDGGFTTHIINATAHHV